MNHDWVIDDCWCFIIQVSFLPTQTHLHHPQFIYSPSPVHPLRSNYGDSGSSKVFVVAVCDFLRAAQPLVHAIAARRELSSSRASLWGWGGEERFATSYHVPKTEPSWYRFGGLFFQGRCRVALRLQVNKFSLIRLPLSVEVNCSLFDERRAM